MRGTRIEKEVEIFVRNLADKTKCMSINAKKWGKKLWQILHIILA
jgi:hypothetical protein